MKKTLLITGALLALTASMVSAGGINLAWTDCLGAGGVVNKNFACTSNTGNNDMYASFDPPITLTTVVGNNQILDLQSAAAVLPNWWQFKNVGTCRLASLQANSGPGTCVDTWSGQGSPGIAAYFTNGNVPSMPLNRARIVGSMAVASAFASQTDPGTEYFSMVFRVNNAKTVGTGLCAGCLDPVCVVLNEISIAQPAGTPGGTVKVTNPLVSNYVTWQGGAVGGPGCPGVTPTINKTWGQVKSLYR